MITQMGTVTLILLLTVLATEAVLPFVPNRGRRRSGRNVNTRVTLVGLGTGIISSLILTLVNVLFPKAANRQSIALWTLPFAIGLAIGIMVLRGLMSRKERPSAGFESAPRLIIGAYLAFAVFHSAPQAMAQAVMIFPVGSEPSSARMVFIFVGYVFGWVVAALFGTFTFKLLGPSRRRWVVSRILVVLALTHLILIVRILQAQRIVSISNEAFEALSWLINREVVSSIVAMSALLALASLVWNEGRLVPFEGASPAQGCLKKARVRLWKPIAGAAAGGYLAEALLITLGVLIGSAEVGLSESESYSVHNKSMVINVAGIPDGHLHRFTYITFSGVEVRFIVIQKAGFSLDVGLDVCEICGTDGYYEKDGKVICKLYEVTMSITTIGFKGGCSPTPIEYEVSNGTPSVPPPVLEASTNIFV